MEPVGLVPLNCVRCGTPVPAGPDEVAWVCAQCGQGLLLDEARGLAAQEVHFAAGTSPGGKGQPFWVVDGQVSLQRDTYAVFGGKTGEALNFWGAPRRFFIPAFDVPLDTCLALGTQLLSRPPALQSGSTIPFESVTLSPRDVPALVDFIVVAIEAERSDKVKEITFTVKLGSPELWIIPLPSSHRG